MVEEHQDVQPEEDIEEDPEEVIFEPDELEEQPQLYDGALLEVDADGDIVIPPTVEDAPEPEAANEDVTMPDAADNDLDDSGDDSSSSEDGSSGEEDGNGYDNEEDEDVDIEGMEDDNMWWLTTKTTMTTRMMTTIMTMRMKLNRAMSTGIAEQNTMSILILVQMVCFVSCWRSYYRT
jgi:hypothetical protein